MFKTNLSLRILRMKFNRKNFEPVVDVQKIIFNYLHGICLQALIKIVFENGFVFSDLLQLVHVALLKKDCTGKGKIIIELIQNKMISCFKI